MRWRENSDQKISGISQSQTCNKAVTWRQRAVACDNCNLWYHANCMGMNSAIYKALEPSNASGTLQW
jgi:hypothetical protein